jgi:hypothetical protein
LPGWSALCTPIAACAAAIACGLPIEGDFDGACAGCGCAHAPSNRAANTMFDVLAIILLVSPAILVGYYRRAPAP